MPTGPNVQMAKRWPPQLQFSSAAAAWARESGLCVSGGSGETQQETSGPRHQCGGAGMVGGGSCPLPPF